MHTRTLAPITTTTTPRLRLKAVVAPPDHPPHHILYSTMCASSILIHPSIHPQHPTTCPIQIHAVQKTCSSPPLIITKSIVIVYIVVFYVDCLLSPHSLLKNKCLMLNSPSDPLAAVAAAPPPFNSNASSINAIAAAPCCVPSSRWLPGKTSN